MSKHLIPEIIAGALILGALTLPGTITGAAVSNLPATTAGISYLLLIALAIIAFLTIRKGIRE